MNRKIAMFFVNYVKRALNFRSSGGRINFGQSKKFQTRSENSFKVTTDLFAWGQFDFSTNLKRVKIQPMSLIPLPHAVSV